MLDPFAIVVFEAFISDVIDTAEAIIYNTYKVSEDSLKEMRSMFMQKYQCDPEQYIATHNKNSEKSET